MKKIIALLLVLATLFSFSACKKKYYAVESTEEEAKTVMTMSVDGKTYEVKYELYRAFFLTYKSTVDGGNADVWVGESKDEYVNRINGMIIERISEIYATFAICERIGFDLYSKDVEKQITEEIKAIVEEKTAEAEREGNKDYEYEDYLAELKANYLNYSVQTLMIRYSIAISAINDYYIGTASVDDVNYGMTLGALEFTKDDVRAFYFGDDCTRVLISSFQKIITDTPEEKAESIKSALANAAATEYSPEEKEAAVFNAIIKSGYFSNGAEVENGYVLGKYNLDRRYYQEMTDAAFGIDEGEVTDPISIVTAEENSYYVIYRSYKSEEHFEANYNEILYVYLTNRVGEITYTVAEELMSSVNFTEALDYSKIGM